MFLKRVRLNVQGVLSFRHWNRKSYSIFNSLGKLVRIGRICVAYSLVSVPVFVLGQSDTTTVDITNKGEAPLYISRLYMDSGELA